MSHLQRGGLQNFANDHCRARSDCGPAVGAGAGVDRGHADVVILQPQRFRGNLAKDGVGSLAKFRARNQHPQASCGGCFQADQSVQIAFTGTRKPGAVQKGGHADTLLARAGAIVCGELSNFGVVARELERAIEQVMHDDWFVDHLIGGGRHPLAQQVAPAEFLGRQADRLGHVIHVPLQRKQALRRAEAAERRVEACWLRKLWSGRGCWASNKGRRRG